MFINRRRGWEISGRLATPEAVALNRRALMGAGAAVLAAGPAQAQWFSPSRLLGGGSVKEQPRQKLEAARNASYDAGRPISAESEVASYNNYYEFGMSKSVMGPAQALPLDPWSVRIEGMVEKPRTLALEDILKAVSLEERVYRHRCVEAWAMTVPWVGFPLSALVRMAAPLASAKYLVVHTLADAKTMPGLRQSFYPWPYTEGVTIQEAANELAFVSVGMYGKTLPPQNGAPLRLTLPWKYGFKSAKSIVKVTFTDQRPVSFWEALQDSEYGFW
ncbi:MAG TPA: protein-methionine-sulfoxide reductase catalytic subunit MsrP, partial [Acetobacteraceae bacterium]